MGTAPASTDAAISDVAEDNVSAAHGVVAGQDDDVSDNDVQQQEDTPAPPEPQQPAPVLAQNVYGPQQAQRHILHL